MKPAIILAAVFGLALVVLLWWISSGADRANQERDKLVGPEGRAELGSRRGQGIVAKPPPGMPQTEAFEFLRVGVPKDDPRRRLGGEVLVSARGNRAVFRRAAWDAARFVRGVLQESDRAALLEKAAALPAGPAADGRFEVVLSDGKTSTARSASEAEAKALFEACGDSSVPWVPPAVRVQVQPFTDVSGKRPLEEWPKAGFPELKDLVDAAQEIKGPTEARQRLCDLLSRNPLLRDPASKTVYELVAFAPVLP